MYGMRNKTVTVIWRPGFIYSFQLIVNATMSGPRGMILERDISLLPT